MTKGSSTEQDCRNPKLDKSGKHPQAQSLVETEILFFFHVHAFDQKEFLWVSFLLWLFCLTEFHFLISPYFFSQLCGLEHTVGIEVRG